VVAGLPPAIKNGEGADALAFRRGKLIKGGIVASLHDSSVREVLKARIRNIQADSKRKWGSMSADQMMWHLCEALDMCVGKLDISKEKNPLPIPMPQFMVRFMVLELPWPHGVPTISKIVPASGKQYDLEAERTRVLATIDEFAARPLNGPWPYHPFMGQLTGEQYSRLQAKHINHHLTQFSV
jgi:hypothetical protein